MRTFACIVAGWCVIGAIVAEWKYRCCLGDGAFWLLYALLWPLAIWEEIE